jgi:RNA polymerase sigma factor (sigma-70 family)
MGLLVTPIVTDSAPSGETFSFANVPRLTAAMKDGDEAAFAWLHAQWSQRINRYCFALSAGDETFAGEIAQAVWLRLVRHVRTLDDESALWNWMARAARNAATDLRRTGGRYLRALGRFSKWVTQPSNPREGEDSADDGLLVALETALTHLTEDERALIEGRYFRGETLDAIGARHALTTRAVEGRLARLRDRLRVLIAEQLKHRQS